MTCDRCGSESLSSTGSYFNTQMICGECDRRERAHPQFANAQRVEGEAVRRGDFNFAGVGLPSDLSGPPT